MPGLDDFSGVSGSSVLGRELPYSEDAEETVLGSILVDPNCLDKVMEIILKPEYFYRPQHQKIYSIILSRFANGSASDVVTLIDETVTAGIFENVAMARTYLMGIADRVLSTEFVVDYCKIIAQKARLRSLLNVANNIIRSVNENNEDAEKLLDKAEQDIYNIRQGRVSDGLTHISDVIAENFMHLEEISGPDAEKNLGARTGFSQLDAVTTGLNRTDLIVLAARPGMGKSAFALNIAVNCCKATGREVVIFSLEMGKEQLVSRMLASEALVNNKSLRNGHIETEDWQKLSEAADVLHKLPIYLDDTAGSTVPQMKSKLRRMKNLGLVVIDYIQLMESPNKHTNRVTEVSEITRQLKLMAKELNVPVIALSQLSRTAERREDKRPMLSDLRESGSIEQDADIIMFLYRDSYYADSQEDQSTAECIVAKNRHGQTDMVKLAWIGEYTLFRGIDFRRDDK